MGSPRAQTDHIGKRHRSLPGHADILEPDQITAVMDEMFRLATDRRFKPGTRKAACEICMDTATAGQFKRYYMPKLGELSVGVTGKRRVTKPQSMAASIAVPRVGVKLPPLLVNLYASLRFERLGPDCEMAAIEEVLGKVGFHFTRGELRNALRIWLRRNGIDGAITGLLLNRNVRQSPQTAYASVPKYEIQAIYTQFLREMFGSCVERKANNVSKHKSWNTFVDGYISSRDELKNPILVGGSMLIPEEEIRALVTEFRQQVVQSTKAANPTNFEGLHNLYVVWTWLLLSLQTGHRDVIAPFEKLQDFDLQRGYLYVEDKANKSGAEGRVLPLAKTSIAQTEAYVRHLKRLVNRYHNLNPKLAHAISGALMSTHAFLGLIDEGDWRPLRPKDCANVFGGMFPGRPNFPRHLFYQAFRKRGANSELQDMFFSHSGIGDDPFSVYSGISMSRFRQVIPAIDDFAQAIGLAPIEFCLEGES